MAVLEGVEKVSSGRTGNFKFAVKKRLHKSCTKVARKLRKSGRKTVGKRFAKVGLKQRVLSRLRRK